MAEQQKPVAPAKPVEPPKKMEFKLLGHNYQTPDLVAKVTGAAKYAEDFRADGMVFIKLMPSPRPHAKIRNIDASAALAMPGVHGILTAKDLPAPPAPPGGPPPVPVARPAGAPAAGGAAPAAGAAAAGAAAAAACRWWSACRWNCHASGSDTRGRHTGSAGRSSGWWWRSRSPGPGCRRGPGDRASAAADAA